MTQETGRLFSQQHIMSHRPCLRGVCTLRLDSSRDSGAGPQGDAQIAADEIQLNPASAKSYSLKKQILIKRTNKTAADPFCDLPSLSTTSFFSLLPKFSVPVYSFFLLYNLIHVRCLCSPSTHVLIPCYVHSQSFRVHCCAVSNLLQQHPVTLQAPLGSERVKLYGALTRHPICHRS